MTLQGQAVAVTGAGRGIGRAIALALAKEGAQVAVLDLLADNAKSVQREIEALGTKALAVPVDLTKVDQVQSAIDGVIGALGRLDVLVNNAGWDRVEPFMDSQPDTWEKIIAINYKAVLYMCKAALPHMIQKNSGKVINIASDAGRVGSMGEAVYSGAKGAVIAFSKSLAREMARYSISVNVVCPGLTETPLLDEIRNTSERAHKIMDSVTRATPFRRVAKPEDIAAAVAFFASPESSYITGQTLSVSGGLTMC